jgi:hypothetical protein
MGFGQPATDATVSIATRAAHTPTSSEVSFATCAARVTDSDVSLATRAAQGSTLTEVLAGTRLALFVMNPSLCSRY